MTSSQDPAKSKSRKGWWLGLTAGVVFTSVVILASGFMIETTNTDTFCVTCHAMNPFRNSWKKAVHGGNNPQGFAAQCVDCHLPHGNFVEYVTAKAITGTGDVFNNLTMDVNTFDWMANGEKNRLRFTYDSACRRCHQQLDAAPGMPRGGFLAHRTYLRGETTKKCAECHPHVGHKDLAQMVNRYFVQ
jgi:cytochrome c nitrite reductase small subunit